MAVRDVVQAAAGALGGDKLYVEDVFSTYLYTGNGSTQTITNGIDLDGEGGLVWTKKRAGGSASSHLLIDTVRGSDKGLATNSSGAQTSGWYPSYFTGFTASGYGISGGANENNATSSTYASWTFRKAEKFFDVITGTTNASGGGTFSHSLGSAPGCIIVKATGTTSNWGVWHRSIPNGSLYLNLTNAQDTSDIRVSSATDTSITITNTFWLPANQSFVAYLFAHDAGGFGDDGEQNVISCGSWTNTSSSGFLDVDLGWEPQWVLFKNTSASENWILVDNMRNWSVTGGSPLYPNLSNAEGTWGGAYAPITSTGFRIDQGAFGASGNTYIYIAIRRGPMKTPESGAEVFSPAKQTGGGFVTTGWPVDLLLNKWNDGTTTGQPFWWVDRLRGAGLKFLRSDNSSAEDSYTTNYFPMSYNNGVEDDWNGTAAQSYFSFRRAPGFFDVVCYTGAGTTKTVDHNLGVVPELIIIKRRNTTGNWSCYSATTGTSKVIELNEAYGAQTASYWGTGPTATTFQVASNVNTANTFVAYLFATCPGVSKVGSYTGTGTTQQINCGFSAGARFVLIKRTDDNSSGTANWYVWDSARGIVAGNDPYLLLNSTAAEVTNTDYVDTYSAGFEISSTAPAAINASGGTFIFLAIA